MSESLHVRCPVIRIEPGFEPIGSVSTPQGLVTKPIGLIAIRIRSPFIPRRATFIPIGPGPARFRLIPGPADLLGQRRLVVFSPGGGI